MNESVTRSEPETAEAGARLAERLFEGRRADQQPPKTVFVRLSGPLGAGKTAFARGFIRKWSQLAGDPIPETIASPSYNIVKLYGVKVPLAHFDLYRLHSMSELEAIGFEQYFFETPCCLVEWLEQIPEAAARIPLHAVTVEMAFGAGEAERALRLRDPEKSS